MSSQLASSAAPMPVNPGVAVVPGAGSAGVGQPPLPPGAGDPAAPLAGAGTATAAGAGSSTQAVMLQTLLASLTQLVALAAAQQGATGVQGGGGIAAPGAITAGAFGATTATGGATAGAPTSLGSMIGGVHFGSTSISSSDFVPIASGTVGGGAAAAPAAAAPVAGAAAGTQASMSVISSESFRPVDPVTLAPTAAAAPAAAAPAPGTAVVGGGALAAATVQVDMSRIAGTPQPGGVIDAIVRGARSDAPGALSEGNWTELVDGAGTRMQLHVHGPWADPRHHGRLLEAIQRGFVVPHVHPDGTVHVHDVR